MRLQEIPVKKQSNNRWFLFHHAFSIGSSICGIAGESVNWWSPHGRRFPTWRKLHANHPFWPAFCWIVCVCVLFLLFKKFTFQLLGWSWNSQTALHKIWWFPVGHLQIYPAPANQNCMSILVGSPDHPTFTSCYNLLTLPETNIFAPETLGLVQTMFLSFWVSASWQVLTLPIFPPPWSTCSPRAASNNMIQVLHTCWWQLGF